MNIDQKLKLFPYSSIYEQTFYTKTVISYCFEKADNGKDLEP